LKYDQKEVGKTTRWRGEGETWLVDALRDHDKGKTWSCTTVGLSKKKKWAKGGREGKETVKRKGCWKDLKKGLLHATEKAP